MKRLLILVLMQFILHRSRITDIQMEVDFHNPRNDLLHIFRRSFHPKREVLCNNIALFLFFFY